MEVLQNEGNILSVNLCQYEYHVSSHMDDLVLKCIRSYSLSLPLPLRDVHLGLCALASGFYRIFDGRSDGRTTLFNRLRDL